MNDILSIDEFQQYEKILWRSLLFSENFIIICSEKILQIRQ